jgi:aminoglycoside 6'-N-acetyltransferase
MSNQVGASGPGFKGRPSVNLRPMARGDFPTLAAWLRAPHVEAWFPWLHGESAASEAVEAEYGPCIDGDDPTELFVIETDGEPVGFIQRYRIGANPEWAAALSVAGESGAVVDDPGAAVGFDYAIGVLEATGRGVGSEAIRQLLDDTFSRYPDVDRVIVAMQQANRASWRALEGVGFERQWAGLLDSPDPSDAGPSYIYVLNR